MQRALGLLTGLAIAAAVVCGASIPTPSSLGSDIFLLYNNDLDQTTAALHHGALLISAHHSNQDAANACKAVGETLLPVNQTFFNDDLVPLLRYQVFQGNFPSSQQFWVANKVTTCQVVSTKGVVSTSKNCSKNLPALCTQSAGFRANATDATSLAVHSQDLDITGFRDQTSFRFFGIRYANPPTRWEYATPYSGNKTLDARSYGSVCVQNFIGTTVGSEDCLFLNIWTPFLPGPNSTTALKPVMFFIHGGAYMEESGNDPNFDGGSLVSRGDVVVVTINYRLSTIGFLALDDGKTNGNYGFADMFLALDWDRITVFGQSAGATATHAMLASPKAVGKFAGAIIQSNLAGANAAKPYSLYYTIPEETSLLAEPIIAEAGCNTTGTDPLDCLRGVDARALVNLPTIVNVLVVDGTYLNVTQVPINGSGPVVNVELLMGVMRDDGVAFTTYPNTTNLTQALIDADLNPAVVGNPLFPEPNGANATLNVFNVTERVTSDVEFRCLDQATIYSGVTHDLFKSVWFYEFNRSYQLTDYNPNAPVCEAPVTPDHPYGDPDAEYFKCHAGELYYVFGSLDQPFRDDKDLPFMQRIVDIWSSFARTYNPNPDPKFLAARGFTDIAKHLAKEGKWEPVTKANLHKKPMRELQWDSFMTPFGMQEQCDFLGYPLTYYE